MTHPRSALAFRHFSSRSLSLCGYRDRIVGRRAGGLRGQVARRPVAHPEDSRKFARSPRCVNGILRSRGLRHVPHHDRFPCTPAPRHSRFGGTYTVRFRLSPREIAELCQQLPCCDIFRIVRCARLSLALARAGLDRSGFPHLERPHISPPSCPL